ncbi:hypothetical protein EU537_12110 [Candidatus Thorarchaeota archaeon]|nr:MAG: hypothetical protein EU537_12110 [Candidatus Thorarchaeota archaeon]
MIRKRSGKLLFTAMLVWLISSPYMGLAVPAQFGAISPNDTFALAEISINAPADLTYENGSRGEEIVWNATTSDPKNYTIFRDSEVFDSGSWDGDLIVADLDELYEGDLLSTLPAEFEFECLVFNQANESASDIVEVTVIQDDTAPIITPSVPSNETYSYEVGSFGHTINWTVIETNPDFFNITRQSNETTSNFTVLDSGDWDGSNFTLDIDGLNASHWYLFTLFVNDTRGYNSTSSINVTVFEDLTAPVVSSPDDISYEFGAEGNKISWHAYDSNPANYSLEVLILYYNTTYGNLSKVHGPPDNITLQEWTFDEPEGENISFSVDYIYLGNYSFTLTLFDDFGYNTSDTVNVTVYKDLRAPVIDTLDDYSYEEGYTDNTLNWSAEENNPKTYNLTKDGEVLLNGTWRGENISISIDGLAVGEYVFNLTLIDFFNQTSIDVVLVTVTPDTHPPTISEIAILESHSTISTNNLTVQAYCWDINNISSITVETYTDSNESVVEQNMTVFAENFYIAYLGEYAFGSTVFYRIVAIDNSSVNLNKTTEWFEYRVTSMQRNSTPILLWAGMLVLGALAGLVVLSIYFRTKTK